MKNKIKIVGCDALYKKIVLFSALLLFLGHSIVFHHHENISAQVAVNAPPYNLDKNLLRNLFSTDQGTGHLTHFSNKGHIDLLAIVPNETFTLPEPVEGTITILHVFPQAVSAPAHENLPGLRAPPLLA